MRTCRVIVLLLLTAPPAIAEPVEDPWAQVPALPTSCYTVDDTFTDKANAASATLQSEKSRQDSVNQAISQQFGTIDIMDLQQRMVTFMMEHPEDAQRVMLAMQQGGQQAQEQTPEMSERSVQLETRLKDLTAEYAAALRQTTGPMEEQRQALRNTKEWCSQASFAKDAALRREENRAYDSLCTRWWKEGGAFHSWFAEFKEFQIEFAAQQDEYADTTKVNYEIMGIPTDQYRPTWYLSAPIEYLRRAVQVFPKRNFAPVSEEQTDECEVGHG